MAASPQQSAGHRVESSFTIKNILNLPEDPNETTESTTLGLSSASPPSPKLIVPFPSRANWSSYPCEPWVRFTTQFYPCGFGGADFARKLRLRLGDDNEGLKIRRRMPMREKKRRSLFSPYLLQKMEKEFVSRQYLKEGRRAELAVELKLTETQVKTWFQNRRTKWRKELRNENPPREVPDGRLKYAIEARK